MKHILLAGLGALALSPMLSSALVAPAAARPFTPNDMVSLDRVSSPTVSPAECAGHGWHTHAAPAIGE